MCVSDKTPAQGNWQCPFCRQNYAGAAGERALALHVKFSHPEARPPKRTVDLGPVYYGQPRHAVVRSSNARTGQSEIGSGSVTRKTE